MRLVLLGDGDSPHLLKWARALAPQVELWAASSRGFAPDSGAPDLTVSATARDFLLLLSRREDPDTLFFSRRLVSEGDTELGLTVKNLLDALDPEAVLHQLPPLLARAAQRLMAV